MSKLGNQASQCSLDKVADALPPALKKSVLQSLNFSTFVWVIKNKDDANKIVKVLRENGFSNISLDSKGTTITAQSSSGSKSVENYTSGTDYSCIGSVVPSCTSIVDYDTCINSYMMFENCGNQCAWDGTYCQNATIDDGYGEPCPGCCGSTTECA